jgi:arylsulfatase A-like enzyme
MNDQPNVLFLMTDQHRFDHVGFNGNPVVQTPNLDALAARSANFTRTYVSNPICMPNRSTIMTGRMPSAHGTRHNGVSLNWRANTYVRVLRQAGYRTSHIGKSHLQNMGVGRRGMLAHVDFSLPAEAFELGLVEGWDELENLERYRSTDPVTLPEDFYGFERADFTVSHGDICGGHYYQWLREKGIDPRAYQGSRCALENYPDWVQVYQTRLPAELYPTCYIAERTLSELDAARADDRPFMIHCSFPDPHHPFSPPGEYWRRFDPRDMPLPETFFQDHRDSMPHVQAYAAERGTPHPDATHPFAPTEDQFRHALAAQYGMIALIDDQIGRILATLEETGLADNTIVVFSSDHGDMFGDHGLILKHTLLYEGCTHVPLLIAAPGIEPGRRDGLASSIDIPGTLLELTGCEPYYDMQGVSLAPMLSEASARVRSCVLIEEDEREDVLHTGQPFRSRTLVTDATRTTIYQGTERGEHYALHDDPQETENRWADAGARSKAVEQLLQELLRLGSHSPRPTYTA